MGRLDLKRERTTGTVIGAFYEVYNTLGFGLMERFYSRALEREIRARGLPVERERCVPVTYKGEPLGLQRIDMLVDRRLVVECKSNFLLPVTAVRQVYNYLRCTGLELALLLHFGPAPKVYRVQWQPKPGRAWAASDRSFDDARS